MTACIAGRGRQVRMGHSSTSQWYSNYRVNVAVFIRLGAYGLTGVSLSQISSTNHILEVKRTCRFADALKWNSASVTVILLFPKLLLQYHQPTSPSGIDPIKAKYTFHGVAKLTLQFGQFRKAIFV
eukprot:gb/GECG01004644.1/.p1 GENE.gb/GECG01004644.1/~~gb/GECG01004644.1/.p1  ORF type:complete len:126 (+),score=7.10 gb/GECG01004644.1/:1-378(+)